MFFDGIKHTLRWEWTTCFILHGVTCCELIGIGKCPPQVCAILTDKGDDEVATVVIGCHLDLTPTDRHFITISDGSDVFRRGVIAVADGLQIRLVVIQGADISDHIYNRGGDPTVVFQLIKLYV